MSNLTSNVKEKRIAIRAGLFVALGLLLAGLVILLIGKERRLFDPQVGFRAAFENVDGLKKDSPVWLGGLEAGRVSAITFSSDLGDKRIEVQIEMSAKYAPRVRQDSVARLTGRGVLGDKAIDISLGSPDSPPLEPGGHLTIGASGDLTSILKAAGPIVENGIAITKGLREAVEAYSDPVLRKDVAGLLKSLHQIMAEVETGDGALHTLIYDKRTGAQTRSAVASLSQLAARVDATASEVEGILREVKNGNGSVHALLYEKRGAQAFTDLGNAAAELSGLIHDAKTSRNGAIHQLVYGDSRGMFADLGAAAADIRKITNTIRSGEGSLGGIINDPTVYEDLKTVLGNVKRNRILRALVRMSIKNGEDMEKVSRPPGKESSSDESEAPPPPGRK